MNDIVVLGWQWYYIKIVIAKGEVKGFMQKALQYTPDFAMAPLHLKSPITSWNWIFKSENPMHTRFCLGTFEQLNNFLFGTWIISTWLVFTQNCNCMINATIGTHTAHKTNKQIHPWPSPIPFIIVEFLPNEILLCLLLWTVITFAGMTK